MPKEWLVLVRKQLWAATHVASTEDGWFVVIRGR
jgi:hypothetical protein